MGLLVRYAHNSCNGFYQLLGRVGRGATIGAGTTLVRNAPDDQLTLSRSEQRSVSGWKRPVRKS